MLRLCEEIEVPRSAADCYRYLLDFSTIEQWDPGVLRARKLTPGAVRDGTEFALTLGYFGRRFDMTYRLLDQVPDHRLQLQGTGAGVRADDCIDLMPRGSQRTRIRYEAELRFSGLGRLGGALLQWPLRRIGRAAVEGLRTALTPEPVLLAPSAPPSLKQRLVLPAALDFTPHGYRAMPRKAHSTFLDGRTIVITGPTAGIGLAAACELSRLGARLVLVGRDRARLETAAQQILDFAGGAHPLRLLEADLSEPTPLARAASAIRAGEARVDVLINNAGALFAERGLTVDGHERSFAINLLAPYRMTSALLPMLARSRGRVINVSSGGQYLQPLHVADLDWTRTPYDGVRAYAQAKRGLVAVTRSWAERHPQIGFHAMHPGWVATPGVAKSLPGFHRVMRRVLRDPRMGADTIVWLCAVARERIGSGSFWLDRRAVPFDLIPGTAVSAAERARLLEHLAARAGDLHTPVPALSA